MLASGAVRPVVGAIVPFDRLPEAHALLQGRGSTGKVVVQL
jgi:NADPH:quinone reductase-like Zn-dependent oxidoreductase